MTTWPSYPKIDVFINFVAYITYLVSEPGLSHIKKGLTYFN